MNFWGHLVFRGKILDHVKREENGNYSLTFDVDGEESYLEFEAPLFESLIKAAAAMTISGEKRVNILPRMAGGEGEIVPCHVTLDLEDEAVKFSAERDCCEDLAEKFPWLDIDAKKEGEGHISLSLNPAQAEELIRRLQLLLEGRKIVREIAKPRVVNPPAPKVAAHTAAA